MTIEKRERKTPFGIADDYVLDGEVQKTVYRYYRPHRLPAWLQFVVWGLTILPWLIMLIW